MITLYDFTKCKIDLTANYGGSDKKRGIILYNKKYMLKLSDKIPEEKRNQLNSSYTNSAFSENIGCRIARTIGFDVQNTLLGNITMQSSKGEERTYPVVACENFVPNGWKLVEFKFIEGAILEKKPGKLPEFDDIYEVMTIPNAYFSEEFGKQALQRYWDTFILDALLGNFDRHANNWGYLVNEDTHEIKLAPVYDCGSCLYPQISDDAIETILNDKDEIQTRIEKFPVAALMKDNKKVSYMEYIKSFENKDCTDALQRIVPHINIDEISKIIDETPGISDIRKTFYKTMISERYNQILLEPYKIITKGKKMTEEKDVPNLDEI